MRVSDITPEYIASLSAEEMEALAWQLEQMGYSGNAQQVRSWWTTNYNLNQNDDKNRQAETAADPIRQLLIGAGGYFLGSGARAAGESAWNALSNAVSGSGTSGTMGDLTAAEAFPYNYIVDQNAAAWEPWTGSNWWETQPETSSSWLPSWLGGGETTPAAGTGGTAGAGAEAGSGVLGTIGESLPYVAAALVAYKSAMEALSRHENLSHQGRDPLRGAGAGWKEWWNDVSKDPLRNWYQINPLAPQASIIQGLVESQFGSGKSREQMAREWGVGRMEDAGLLGENDVIQFDDGSTFDLGQNDRMLKGGEYDGQRHFYDVNWQNKLSPQVVGALNPLVTSLFAGQDEDLQAQMAGMLTNSVLEGGGDWNQRINQLYSNAGFDSTSMDSRNAEYNNVLNLASQKLITPEQRNAQLAAIDARYGVVNPNQGKGGKEEFGDNWIPGT